MTRAASGTLSKFSRNIRHFCMLIYCRADIAWSGLCSHGSGI